MPVGFPSIRVDEANARHHLWCNNGTWWVHYTVHFDQRKRRVRRSLRTRSLAEAIVRRDSLLLRIASDGDPVPERPRPELAATVDRRAFA
ncbi:MAG: hypothetical protein ACKOTB_03580 [Planctomycetia bacterium]